MCAVSGKLGVDGWVARSYYYVCSGLCHLGSFVVCVFDGLRGGSKRMTKKLSAKHVQVSTSEEGKGQDTTSQKWKKQLQRSGKSCF